MNNAGWPAILGAVLLIGTAEAKREKPDPALRRHYVNVYAVAEHFEWHEFLDDQTLLIESGPVYGVEVSGGYTENNRIWFRYYGRLFRGDVDYDGALQDGTPHSRTTTEYCGFEGGLEGDIWTFAHSARGDVLNLIVGFGCRAWERNLVGPTGYVETWKSFYINTGLWGRCALPGSENHHLRSKLEVRLPVYNTEKADFSRLGAPPVHLRPGWAPSLYGSLGADIGRLSVEGYLQALWFSQSKLTDEGFYQPESLGIMGGIKAGISF